MTSTYLNQLIDEFDQEFESLIIPFPNAYVVTPTTPVVEETVKETFEIFKDSNDEVENIQTTNKEINSESSASQKLSQIEAYATKISAERYNTNYNPEISLANLLNYILSDNENMQNDFFQLLNQDNNSNLDQVLNDFDFYLNNPFKKKAEKILSKIEARKNK